MAELGKRANVAVNYVGKVKTALQMVSIGFCSGKACILGLSFGFCLALYCRCTHALVYGHLSQSRFGLSLCPKNKPAPKRYKFFIPKQKL